MAIIWSRERSRTINKGTSPGWWYNLYGTDAHGMSAIPSPLPMQNRQMGTIDQTTLDMEVDHFKSRIQSGDIINNPYMTTKIEKINPYPATFHNEWTDSSSTERVWCAQHGVYHDKVFIREGKWANWEIPYLETFKAGVVESSMRQQVLDQAVVSAFANVDPSEMLALATIAESHKSVESMTAILTRAYRVLRRARKLQFAALAKELKPNELADRWMEVRYAIRPIIYDCHGVAKALQKARGYARRTFRGYAETSAYNEDTVIGTGAPISDDWKRKIDLKYSCRAGVLCDVSVTDLNVLGFDQLAETAWELVPFSFIADWFANTGDWIAAHTPNAGVTQRASWATIKKVKIKSQSVFNCRWNLTSTQRGRILTQVRPEFRVEETVLERVVEPALSTFPTAKFRLDVYKLTDLGIILRRLF